MAAAVDAGVGLASFRTRRLLVLGLLLLAGAGATTAANTLEGLVVAVHDGDTLTVLDEARVQHKVRLAGIDAPESRQPFGRRSKQGLAEHAFQRVAVVTWHKRDRYGRLVGKVLIDHADVNLAQVAAGLAWHYVEYQREQAPDDRELYAAAERGARQARVGLWADPSPVAPWVYRTALRESIAFGHDRSPRQHAPLRAMQIADRYTDSPVQESQKVGP